MNDEGTAYRERRVTHINERLCIISLGILMTGFAHGATESELGGGCSREPTEDGLSSQQVQKCLLGETANVEHGDASDAGGSKVYVAASGVDDVEDDELNIEDTEPDEMDVVDEPYEEDDIADQDIDEVGGDGQGVSMEDSVPQQVSAVREALEMNSSTTGPEGTELFNVDIETAEEIDGDVPSANDRGLFGIGSTSMKSSDDYDARTDSFSYRYNRREWFWPWQEASVRGLDWGVDVNRTTGDARTTEFDARHVQGMLGGYLTRGTYFQAQLGKHTLETDLGERNITSRHVAAMFGLKQNFSVQFETGRDFIYTEGSVAGGITKQLAASEHSVSFRWRPYLRLRFQGQSGYRKHEEDIDENEARIADFSALYGIHPGWPWVWVGVGGKQLNYQREVSDYWSPDLFKAYGLRFESSFPLLKRITGSAAASLDRVDEDGSRGNGYDIKAGLQYRLFGQLYGRVELQKSRSIQQDSTWTSDNISFSLNGPLF